MKKISLTFLCYLWMELPLMAQQTEICLQHLPEIADVGDRDLAPEVLFSGSENVSFSSLTKASANIGFTNHHYWLRFSLKNASEHPAFTYLETARPITDFAELYLIDKEGNVKELKSGDNLPFSQRSVNHRKTIFKVMIQSNQELRAYLHLKSDGEVLNVPLHLYGPDTLVETTYREQMVFGIFYGILALATIIYLFLYFALRERSFLYYSMYALGVAFLQFAIDGYFYQYLAPSGGWFSQRMVLIAASLSAICLGKYSELFLNIKRHSNTLFRLYRLFYLLLGLQLILLLVLPASIPFLYPSANAFGLGVMLLLIVSLANLRMRKIPVDRFFGMGIFFLVSGFVIFILNNFGVLPNSFWSENSPKLGTGLEIIFLSLSMANRIGQLRRDKENMQTLALQRAEEISEVKSHFLSNMSHELRTPLNAIMGHAKIIHDETTDPKTRTNCEVIKYVSINMLSSVNDILDLSKIGKGELQLEHVNFDPESILIQLKKCAEITAKEKGLNFVFDPPVSLPKLVKGDPIRLEQIVNNVLNNALRFTHSGEVKFAVRCCIANEMANLELTISDTGIGISKEKVDKVLEAFTQENSSNTREYGGFGLGLHMVKVLVDLHHGTIGFESQPGRGTTCTIGLQYPLANMLKTVIGIPKNDSYDLHGKHILVVEDNPMNLLVIKAMMSKWMNTILHFATNGLEGVEVVKNNPIDLVLMDLHMPVMDGYEATAAIRSGDAGALKKTIPIMALTADVLEITRQKVLAKGMNDYLPKPVDQEVLFEKISNLLELETSF